MSRSNSMGYPSKYLVKEIEYTRKAAIAFGNNQKLRYFFYDKLSKYYSNKHFKEIMSS